MKDLIEQILKMARSEQKQHEMMRDVVTKENKLKYLCENARQLNEILLVDTLKDLTIEDKIIELDESGKHI